MKKLCLALLAMATALAIAPAALADTISINFTPTGSPVTVVTTTAGGMISFSTGVNLEVLGFNTSNANSNNSYALSVTDADVTITSAYGTAPSIAGDTILVTSASCGVSHVCLTGAWNSGAYASKSGGTGEYSGAFTVDSVSSAITALFGDHGFIANSGTDVFNTHKNSITIVDPLEKNGTSDLSGGTINFDTPVPEPSSLMLLGTGLLGLAFVAFRKAKSSGVVLSM
jgi:hypothetical protein